MVAAGDLVGGRYVLEERLASGGMGTVFRATDQKLVRTVALKLLRQELAQDARFVERFRREARAVAAMGHPNVATVFDYGTDEDRHFIVMELAPGKDLAARLDEEGALGAERTVKIAAQIAAALSHAHSAGIVHRDVKPANVIVADDDSVKVTDFGIARAVGDSTLTATGTLLGTATYLSPEQAQGAPADARSDIYSLGIVMFEMLTGRAPFEGESAVNVAMQHVTHDVPSVSEVTPGIPAWLDAVVLKATRRDPAERFPDGTSLTKALARTGATGTAVLPVDSAEETAVMNGSTDHLPLPLPPGWDPARLGRTVLWVAGALLVVAAILVLWRLGQTDPVADDVRREATTDPGEESPSEDAENLVYTLPKDLVGSDASVATELLEELGFVVETVPVEHEDPAGTVVETDPEIGSEVTPGDTITLHVSDGSDEDEDKKDKGPPGGVPPGKAKKEDD